MVFSDVHTWKIHWLYTSTAYRYKMKKHVFLAFGNVQYGYTIEATIHIAFFDTIQLYLLTAKQYCGNLHLNNLLQSKSTNIADGWTIDCNEGVWNRAIGTGNWNNCQNWYGWKSSYKVGSIATTLSSFGRAKLNFGNCYSQYGFIKTKVCFLVLLFLNYGQICSTSTSP